jgi:hypothetical protein
MDTSRPKIKGHKKYFCKENIMNHLKTFFVISMGFFFITSAAIAGDFDWLEDFNIKAEADPSGFKATLSARFKIGDAQIETVLTNVEKPADAYVVLRLGEMSGRSTDSVIRHYKSGKGKGWGAIAKSLGIKPGSKEFHALKRGYGLHDDKKRQKGKEKGEGKSKGKGKK